MAENCIIKTVKIDEMYRYVLECQRQKNRLVAITATATEDGAELIYSLADGYELKNYRIIVSQDTEINSISDIYPSAALFENEIRELFGVKIDSINIDFQNKFYRITKEAPFKRVKDSVKIVPPKAENESSKKEEQ